MMAQRQHLESSDGERIVAQVDLRKKCRELPMRSAADDPVARAEAALQKMSGHFRGWMDEELTTIDEAWKRLRAAGIADDTARAGLFRAAHDIKGQAATLGFPLVGVLAGSLCALLDEPADPGAVPAVLIEQHVAGLKAMVREDVRNEDDPVATQLVGELSRVTRGFIASVAPRS
ncbi:Hpt domain-containing protein [Methylobrevis albus]|nr:Hpt domain-containing protein [Methylobrevis albus]